MHTLLYLISEFFRSVQLRQPWKSPHWIWEKDLRHPVANAWLQHYKLTSPEADDISCFRAYRDSFGHFTKYLASLPGLVEIDSSECNLCSRLTVLWRFINFVLLSLLLDCLNWDN